jgi:superfamily I DNA and/or RNA helicase
MLNFSKRKTNFVAIKSLLVDHIRQLENKKSSIPEDVFDVTKFSIEEILKTFESMDILIKKEDFEGCIKLSRTILENSINLRYIYKEDIEKRAKNFKTSSIKKLSDKFNTLKDDTPEAKEMNDYFQLLLKDYIPEKKIRDKFKAVDSDDLYLRSYKRLSEYIHPVYRPKQINFNENSPYILEMKRTVRSDTSIVTLTALQDVCVKYNLDGGIMMIDDMGYKATIFFATNPNKAEKYMQHKE